MSPSPRSPAPALLSLLLLAGCAGPAGYPSLQPRAIEDVSLAEPTIAAAQPGAVPPALEDRYAGAIGKARKADAAFRVALSEERGAILRGKSAAFGSDAWTDAQQSLSRVEAARTPVASILADLDAARDTNETRADSSLLAAAAAAFDTVEQIDTEEAQALAAIRGPAS